ncbi:hypothetical protein F5144DRAFT_574972 [Chaetomium tenue]|uniref:Uncharacterized protein n=2 Tax=Chaetomium tenue TaxID=1854479 RepID=A0ACB7P8Q2_9PEZI|nr:hypothetical protein F5144DRAFT_574319 [Chaetomium globosum]KAH6632705.1 hypothetical protein F5144DRAFT_574972 [Chaetomium globosum]
MQPAGGVRWQYPEPIIKRKHVTNERARTAVLRMLRAKTREHHEHSLLRMLRAKTREHHEQR